MIKGAFMQALNIFVLLHLALIMSSCAHVGRVENTRPSWIDNPGKGVSASAGMHVGGRVAQEQLAILRGREEYAKRFGVNIESEQLSTTSVINDRSSTASLKVTREDSKQSDIKALVKEKWREPDSDVLWVWLVPTDQ
jgi:hypothetical protein